MQDEVLGSLTTVFRANLAPLRKGGVMAKGLLTKIGAAFKRFGAVGFSAFAGVGMIMSNFVSKVIASFSQLDTAVREVSTLLNMSENDIIALREAMLSLSERTGKTALDLTKSMYQIVSAGFDMTESMKILTISSEMAKGGITSTEVAADALTTILNAFGKEVKDVTNISDIFFTTVKMGKTRIEELAVGIGNVSTQANVFGLSFEELSAILAIATKSGIKTQIAMTYIKGSLTALGSPTAEAQKIMTKLGITFLDTTGKLKPMPEILKLVTYAIEELQKEGMAAPMAWRKIIPSVEAATMMMLLTEKSKEYSEALQEMEASAGATSAASKKMEESFSEKQAKLQASLTRVYVDIASEIAPVLSDATESIHKFVGMFSMIPPWLKKGTAMTLLFAAAIGFVLSPLMQTSQMLMMLIPLIGQLAVTHGGAAAATQAHAVANASLAVSFWGAVSAIKAATIAMLLWMKSNPIGWLMGIVAVLIVVVTALKKFRTTTKDVSDAMKAEADAATKLVSAQSALESSILDLSNTTSLSEKAIKAYDEAVKENGENTEKSRIALLKKEKALEALMIAESAYGEQLQETSELFEEKIDAVVKLGKIENKYWKSQISEINIAMQYGDIWSSKSKYNQQDITDAENRRMISKKITTDKILRMYADEINVITESERNIKRLTDLKNKENESTIPNLLLIAQLTNRIETEKAALEDRNNSLADSLKSNLNPQQTEYVSLLAEQQLALGDWEDAEQSLGDAIIESAAATDRLISATKKLNDAREEQKDLAWDIRGVELDLADAEDRVTDAQEKLDEALQEHGKHSKEAEKAERDLERTERRRTEVTEGLADAQEKLNKLNADATEIGSIAYAEQQEKIQEKKAEVAQKKVDILKSEKPIEGSVAQYFEDYKEQYAEAIAYNKEHEAELWPTAPAKRPLGAFFEKIREKIPELPSSKTVNLEAPINVEVNAVIETKEDSKGLAESIGLDVAQKLRAIRRSAGYV